MTDNPPAVIAILRENDRVLVIRRGPKVISPGWWTLPGGRIETGESEEAALVREMSEELALEVTPLAKVWECDTDRSRSDVRGRSRVLQARAPRPRLRRL